MVLWQFITFTVLIGALFIYAAIISRRLGCIDTRLTRIEETLLAQTRSVDSADTRATEAKPDGSGRHEGRRDYLTIRDLRVRNEQLRATRSNTRSSLAIPETRDAPKTRGEPLNLPTMRALSEDSAALSEDSAAVSEDSGATSLEGRDTPATSSEPLNLPSMRAVSEDSARTSLESHDEAPAATSEPPNPPGQHPPSDDSAAAKKNRDMLLYLSNQRRRRRARLGY